MANIQYYRVQTQNSQGACPLRMIGRSCSRIVRLIVRSWHILPIHSVRALRPGYCFQVQPPSPGVGASPPGRPLSQASHRHCPMAPDPRVRARLSADLPLPLPLLLGEFSGHPSLQCPLQQRGRQPLTPSFRPCQHQDAETAHPTHRATQLLRSLTHAYPDR